MTEKQEKAIDRLMKDDRLFVDVTDIADILESSPQGLRDTAHRQVSQLGFNAMTVNSRVKIPRIPFLKWLGVL